MKVPRLANAELAVMQLLWEQGCLTARHIREQLYSGSAKAQHGTIQRLLLRLEEKGFVERDRSLPVHRFSALKSRETYASGQLEAIADKLTDGSLAPLITHLIEQKKISRAEVERLRAILNERTNVGGDG